MTSPRNRPTPSVAAIASAGNLAGCARRELAPASREAASKFGGAWRRRGWKANET
jgi:hypothetical protein